MPQLLRELKKFYKAHGRNHLPWRRTKDPYKILVSEVMLQQTQVDRVLPYYERWVKTYPTAQALAKAKLPEVLMMWQGLGYNRRAKYLHETSKILSEAKSFGRGSRGRVYLSRSQELFAQPLPGVGPYTRGAVLAFAFNQPEVFVETNIRTVIFHHLTNATIYRSIGDKELLPIVAELLKRSKMEPREFYAAMMDYGAHLKKQGVRLNSRSKHYAKQSRFEGSARQLRGDILRELLKAPHSEAQLIKNLRRSATEVKRQLGRLEREGLIRRTGRRFAIPSF